MTSPAAVRATRDLSLAESAARTRLLADLVAAYARQGAPRTVCVVGNAPQAPSAERAAHIDGSDLVVRVNSFVLDEDGSAPRYGRRCDVALLTRQIRPSRHVFTEYSRRLYLLFEPDRVVDGDGGGRDHSPEWWPLDLGMLHVPNEPFTMLSTTALGFDPYSELRWATTGTMAIWLMAHLFPDAVVSLCGFSFLDDTRQVEWAHADGEVCNIGDTVHRLDREAALVHALLATGRVRLAPAGT